MPIYSPTGFLDITNATLRTSNTECQNLQIGSGNVYVTTDLTSDLVLNLENITNLGATTSNTVVFSNAITGLTVSSNLVATGNVTAGTFLGNGSGLTNIPPSAITGTLSQWSDGTNSDVYIASNVGIGNVHTLTSNTLQVGANLYVRDADANVLTVTGNVAATRFVGDGSLLTGIASNLHQVVENGNVTSNTVQFTNATTGLVATGNVEASKFIGDGSLLTGIASNLHQVVENGNVTSNTVQFTNATTGLVATGNVHALKFFGDGSELTGSGTSPGDVLRISNLEYSNTFIWSNLASNVDRIVSLETSNAAIWSNLASNVERIEDLETSNTAIWSNLASNVERIEDLETSNAAIWSNLASNVTRIETLESATGGTYGTLAHQQELIDPNVTTADYFGISTDISSDGMYAIVGAYGDDAKGNRAGAAHIFVRSGSGSNPWVYQDELLDPNGASDDFFGTSVAISDDGIYAIVGAYGDDNAGSGAGAVHIFTRNTATNVWTHQQELVGSTTTEYDEFGASVAISGDGTLVIVGAKFWDAPASVANAGAAYIFVRSGSGSNPWTQEQQLAEPNGKSSDNLGASVAISSDGMYAIVGADGDDAGRVWPYTTVNSAGAAHIFVRSGSGSTMWVHQQEIYNPTEIAYDKFGESVGISSDGMYVIVGIPRDDAGGTQAGAAQVFLRSGSSWNMQTELVDPNASGSDYFGTSVAISGDGLHAIVGAYGDDVPGKSDAGAAHTFTRSVTTWSHAIELLDPNASAGDHFGRSVSISNSGTYIAIGSVTDQGGNSLGAAHIFNTPLILDGDRITDLETNGIISNSSSITSVTQGDLIYASADSTLQTLTLGATAGHVLKVSVGGLPEWAAATLTTPRSIGGVDFDGSADIVPTTFGAATFDTDTLVVDSVNNRVGIGTTSPTNSLHVYKAAEEQTSGLFIEKATGGTGTAQVTFGVNNTTENPGVAKAGIFFERGLPNGRGHLKFCVDGVNDANNVGLADTVMTINSSGNVGIGTTSPGAKLDVNGAVILTGGGHGSRPANDGGVLANAEIRGGPGLGSAGFLRLSGGGYNNGSASDPTSKSFIDLCGYSSTTDFDRNISFHTLNQERMRINLSGYVGIGTTDPTELLDITAASGDYNAFIRLRSGSGGSSPVTESGLKLTESGEYGFQFAHNAATDLLKIRHQNSAGNVDLDNIMVWNPNGNVGIGKTDPGQKLDVNGVIKSTVPSWHMYNTNTVHTGTLNFTTNKLTPQNCSVSLSTGRVTITVAGRYCVSFHAFTESSVTAGSGCQIKILKSGSDYVRNYHIQPVTGVATGPTVSSSLSATGGLTAIMDLAVNDYVEVNTNFLVHFNLGATFSGFMIG